MCHGMTREEWKLLQQEERRADEEPRIEVVSEPEPAEAELEREPERELVNA
jgi:hypothetical protein